MSVYMIATIRADFKKVQMLRLIDTNTGKVADYNINNVIQAIQKGNIKIENLKVTGNELEYSCGSVDRYPKFIYGIGVIDKSPVTITKVYLNGDYETVNGVGESFRVPKIELINYFYDEGVSNGTVVNHLGGEPYIKCLSGEFEKETPIDFKLRQERMAMKARVFGCFADFDIRGKEFKWLNKNSKFIKVPDNINRIADYGFEGCDVSSILFGKDVSYIGKGAFKGCNDLKELILPASLIEIRGVEFIDSKLQTITIPPTTKIISPNAFRGISTLKKVYYSNRTQRELIKVGAGVKREFK